MKNILLAAFMTTALLLAPMKQALAGGEPFIAEIIIFAGTFAPRGFKFCEGQLLTVGKAENDALFSLIGTTYGGDGATTFALPNLKEAEKALGGARYIIALDGIYPSRP